MDISNIVRRYVAAAIAHGEATLNDYRTANEQYDEMEKALHELDDLGRRDLLLDLLEYDNAFVRCSAAADTLRIDEERATSVLVDLSKERGIVGFDAEMILKEWKKGNLR
jgi:hypothetical protein